MTPKNTTYAAWFPPDGEIKQSEESIVIPKTGQIRNFVAVLERKDGSTYITSQINLPPQLTKSTLKFRQDLCRDMIVEGVKGKVLEEKKIEMAGLAGKEYLIKSPTEMIRMRLIGPGVQIYRIFVAGTKEQINSADAEAFFDNFKRVSRIKSSDKDK